MPAVGAVSTPTSEGRRKKRKPKRLSEWISPPFTSKFRNYLFMYAVWLWRYGQLLNVALFFVFLAVFCVKKSKTEVVQWALFTWPYVGEFAKVLAHYACVPGRTVPTTYLPTDVGNKNQHASYRYMSIVYPVYLHRKKKYF